MLKQLSLKEFNWDQSGNLFLLLQSSLRSIYLKKNIADFILATMNVYQNAVQS